MYSHLLVPIDGTDLSTVVVGNAVELAYSLGARITFFHAQANYNASFFGDAELVRVTSSDDFAYSFQGRARELLAKAESAARAKGVACNSVSNVCNKTYQAIIDAAKEAQCDLIFMASHGRNSHLGMMLGSQTLKVLMNSDIPVLVSSNKDPSMQALTIGIIRDEHRSLAAVLHGWQHLVKTSVEEGETLIDHQLLRAMVRYINDFPLALHHPKESEYLFKRLRLRTSEFDADLDELDRQHELDHQLMGILTNTVEDYCAGTLSTPTLLSAVDQYAQFIWNHMGREEAIIIPGAQRELTSSDWSELHAAFSSNQDPRFNSDSDFKHLFSRIVNLVPSRKATKGNDRT